MIHRWNDLATPSRPAVQFHQIKQNDGHDSTGADNSRCESAVPQLCCGTQPLARGR